MLILSDEGGLPIYTRALSIDRLGKIINREDPDLSSKNETVVLMSGLIEAIMQLKDIVRPTLSKLCVDDEINFGLFHDDHLQIIQQNMHQLSQYLNPLCSLLGYQPDQRDRNNLFVSFACCLRTPVTHEKNSRMQGVLSM